MANQILQSFVVCAAPYPESLVGATTREDDTQRGEPLYSTLTT